MEIELFVIEGGWGYRAGGVYQPYHPEKEGFASMTREEAQALAEQVKARLDAG